MIISNKRGIYELLHALPNDLSLWTLENWKISGKSQNFVELESSVQSSSQNENFLNTSQKLLKNRN